MPNSKGNAPGTTEAWHRRAPRWIAYDLEFFRESAPSGTNHETKRTMAIGGERSARSVDAVPPLGIARAGARLAGRSVVAWLASSSRLRTPPAISLRLPSTETAVGN
jgi:hypothetical protein